MRLFNLSAQRLLPIITATTLLSGSFALAHDSLESTRTAPVYMSLQCIYDYLSNKKDGLEGVNYGFKWLTNLVANTKDKRDESRYIKYSQMTTEQILNECSQRNRASEKTRISAGELAVHLGKIQKQTEDIKATWENQLGNLVQVRREALRMTLAFAKPRAYCYVAGISAGASVVLAVSAQAKVGHCASLSGRQWIDLQLGAGLGVNLAGDKIPYGGAGVAIEGGASHRSDGLIGGQPTMNAGGGAALVVTTEAERESDRTIKGQIDGQQMGVGVGGFYWTTDGYKVGLTIFPLPDVPHFIVEYFDDMINRKSDSTSSIPYKVQIDNEINSLRYFIEAAPALLKQETEDEIFSFQNNPMP